MAEPCFIHLHVHSDYSIIDGLVKVNSLIERAASLHMPALAITDFTNLCGLIKFYNAAHRAGIKPIIGADFLVRSKMLGNELTELTMLAANNVGYQHLKLLISQAYQRGYGTEGPFIDRDWLINHHEGLILLSGGCKGDVGKYLIRGNMSQVEQCLAFYEYYFPKCYYLELIRTGRHDEDHYLNAAIELATYKGLPVVASNDVRFMNADDFDAHEIRVAINGGFTIADAKRPRKYSRQQFMRSEQEMAKLFADLPEALENSVEIARRCNVTISLGEHFLPKFPINKVSTEDYLNLCSRQGLDERLLFLFPDDKERQSKRTQYDDRLNVELQVIIKMGLASYFLIVMEFIQWAKDNGIPVGPGRGSGTGSLVAYVLKITDLNPMEFNLLFERFLNSERVSMPDLDVDFCMEKRDMVIDHVAEIYGHDAVAQIITFGTMAAKAVIRDVGRALDYPYSFVERISKLVPIDPGMTLDRSFAAEPQLQTIYNSDEDVKVLINMSRKLEGVIRNVGKHAGGVVIAPTKITDFTPLYCDSEGNHPVTQFDKTDVEYIGLIKFDFLGLRTLTIINRALDMLNYRRIQQGLLPINIASIPLNDKKSFDILKRAETTAVFQLESCGMKDLIKRLQPDCFEDMIALVALFRPGPLQSGMVDNFINRKHGREKIFYPDIKWQHELLKPVLESTYGIILYQEQVMQIAQVLAGYTLGGADVLRCAMGKKRPEEMVKQRSVFKAGAESIGVDGELSMKIFDLVEMFAGYGFNKSHSAAYALVSYQTLWLKANYPAEFMAAVMTIDIDNTDKIVRLIDECWRIGLKVLPPDINKSQYNFYVNNEGDIVYGIGAIKGIGKTSIEAIIEARNHGGDFSTLLDLCTRTDIKKLNRSVLEKLIISGACDCFGLHRAALMSSIGDIFKAADQYSKAEILGQIDMFGILAEVPEIVMNYYSHILSWPEEVVLEKEHEVLGLYLTSHPIKQYMQEIEYYASGVRLKDLYSVNRGMVVTVAGLVLSVRVVVNKQGKNISVCTLDDGSSHIDIMVFTNVLKKYQKLLKKGRILIVKGKVNFNYLNGGLKMIAYELMDIMEAREKYVRRIAISLNNKQINSKFLKRLRLYLESHRSGNIPIDLYYQQKDACALLYFSTGWRITPTNCLLNDLRTLIGNKQVELKFD